MMRQNHSVIRTWLLRIGVAGLLAAPAGVRSAPTAAPAPNDFYAQSLTSAEVLQCWYNDKGLWDTTGWWNAANCLEAIASVIELTDGQQYLGVLEKTFARNRRDDFLNEFYDDEGWWALAWIRAFDLTGETKYLAMAKTIFADMKGGWDDHCGGGIWWKKDRRYKNAIANELFLLTAIRLHQRTPGDAGAGSYLDWAQRTWAWFQQSGMINSDSMVNDGLNERCENNRHPTWTYNQGVILGGLVELYRSTGDTNLLQQARTLADASTRTLVNSRGILREPNEPRGLRGADGPQFKGIYIRHLAELAELTGDAGYREFLERNARSVWQNNRDATNRFGGRWSGPVDTVDAARHSSAMRVITALAEQPVVLTNVPAAGAYGWTAVEAKPQIGRRIGQLQWAANPLADLKSGLLASVTPAQNLTPGEYEFTAELKVDNFNRDAAVVATLSVVEADSQRVVAQRELKRSDFPNVLYRNFVLQFQAAAGQRYVCRVFWHHAPTAPQLTLRSLKLAPVKR